MAKHSSKKQALGWVGSKILESDLTKEKEEGFLTESTKIIFPSNETIPRPQDGYWVMFLAFLLRGFSLLAHEFLCGLFFVYDVQLHQLMPNSILHIVCFITLCEAFLGVSPHWGLWKHLFHLCRNMSKEEIHDLGGAIVSVCLESQYLKFEMAYSVQNWRQKWFYIKDQKSFESDLYGLAPFDLSKSVMKLKSWDALPSKSEAEEIQPLLACIL
jgi:hypothetical protein